MLVESMFGELHRWVVGQRYLAIDGAQGANQTDERRIADIRIRFFSLSPNCRILLKPALQIPSLADKS